MHKTVISLILLIIALALGIVTLRIVAVQDLLMGYMLKAAMSQDTERVYEEKTLKAFVCGSSSPIPAPGRAQACIAVLTPEHFYIIDSGVGSTDNIIASRLPMQRLQGVFITHFHSDHIAEIPEVNLNSWVQGRTEPLEIIGPPGIEQIVTGLNSAYAPDRHYRTAHHGADLLPPALGTLKAKTLSVGEVLQDGALRVTAFPAEHAPVQPALGYRFDYHGRSLVISGDSLVTEQTELMVQDADLLLHDALSEPLMSHLITAAAAAGRHRNEQIFSDVLDYHAGTSALRTLGERSNVGMIAYYHLVPAPSNMVMQRIFERNLPENHLIAEDRMWFELPAGSKEIIISED